MTVSFASLAFGSALSIASILFGVFGFLYSIYAMFISQISPENRIPAPIVDTIRNFCRLLSLLIVLSTGVSAFSLFFLGLGLLDWMVGAVLVLVIGATAGMSWSIAFSKMSDKK
jgi:hypothetical protein